MENLKNKIILITGAGSGLGRHIARILGTHGATIAVNDINPDRAEHTVRIVQEAGGNAKSYLADIAKKFPVQALFNEIEDDWGRLDAIINNARVVPYKPVLDMDEWEWRRTIDVNLTGAFILAQVGGRIMRTTGAGDFIQPIQHLAKTQDNVAYQTSIAGVDRMVSMASEELLAAGVKMHTVTYKDDDYDRAAQTILTMLEGSITPE